MTEQVRFRILPEQSHLRITAKSNVHPIHGEAKALEGYVDLVLSDGRPDLSAPSSARLELGVDQIKADNALYENELRRRLDTRRYPRIVAQLTQVEGGGDGAYKVEGQLTFHGMTRVVATPMTVRVHDERRLEAAWDQTIDIREFNLKAPRILAFKVEPVVEVSLKVVAERETGGTT